MRGRLLVALLILPLASCSGTVKTSRGLDSLGQVNLKKGQAYLADKAYDAALVCFEETLKEDATNVAALIGRGRVYAGKGDYDQAIANYTTALDADPNSGLARLYRCLAYAEKEEYGHATVDLAAAKKSNLGSINPDEEFAAVYARHGRDYQEAKNLAKAKECFEIALGHDASPPSYHLSMAVVYDSLQNWDGAIQEYEEAIKLGEPTTKVAVPLAGVYLSRARYYRSQQNTQQAQADFTQALHLNPNLKVYQSEFPLPKGGN